ncbi:MAG: hypothetical protein KMY53_11590 [Desulfarculus sp.]|nr:hypothetical protein [Pseudomonadota bacterium]MBU4600087.1 hypothetical protein [Pseudomonadota bacterium]MBV1715669.1 hypothetical protein [Desulfarculus sp.]MBV1738799.1 hypothetical protein [Desulfarculus sp.]
MSNKKLDELLAKLEATEADLSQRATQASEAASANRNQRERAMAAFKAASVAGDKKAQAEAQALIKTLDAEHEMLATEASALMEALEGSGPLRPIALAIRTEAEAAARARQAQWEQHAARLQALAGEYLETVAQMGRLQQNGMGLPAWERAKNFLGRGEDVLSGAILPSVVHETQRGDIYALVSKTIEQTFRQMRVVNNG